MSSRKKSQLYRSYVYIGFLVGIPALATIYGIYLLAIGEVSAFDIGACLIGTALIMIGVTAGYHRMVVHKSFEAHPVVRAFFLALGSMALQGPVISWASVHLKHHAFSDHEGDPHSPNVDSFIHAHFEWMMEMSFEDVHAIRAQYGKRFMNDPMIRFFDKTFHLWTVVSLLIPFLIGGWSCLLWGGLIRVFLSSHITWSVNSLCHVAGGRMFMTKDQSRNNWIVGLLAMGEGWHNNHHAFPSSAFHGMKWWQVDVSAYIIRILEKTRLANKVVRIPKEHIEQQLAKTRDGVKAMQDAVQEKVHKATQSASELAMAARNSAEEVAESMKMKLEESKEKLAEQADEIVHSVEAAIAPKEKLA